MNDYTFNPPSNPQPIPETPSNGAPVSKKQDISQKNDIPNYILPTGGNLLPSNEPHIQNPVADQENIQTLHQTVDRLETALKVLNVADTSINVVLSGMQINKLTAMTTSIVQSLFNIHDETLIHYHETTEALTLPGTTVEILLRVSQLLLKSILIKAKKDQLAEMKINDSQNPLLLELEKEIEVMDGEIWNMSKEFALVNFIKAPSIANEIYGTLTKFGWVAHITEVSSSLGIVTNILKIIPPAIELHNARKIEASSAKEMKGLIPNRIMIPKQIIDSEGKFGTFKGTPSLLKGKVSILEEREKKGDEPLNQLLLQLESASNGDFDSFRYELEKKGIHFDESITNFAIFKYELDHGLRENLVKQQVNYQDALTTMAKSQIKDRLLTHEKTNHLFFQFKRKIAAASLGMTIYSALLGTALTITALLVATFPPVLFIIPAILTISIGIGLLTAKIIHLKTHKPNLAKLLLRGIKIETFINQALLYYYDWKLVKEKIKELELEKKINSVIQNEAEVEKTKQKIKEAVSYYEKLHNQYQSKIRDLENEIKEARIADFEFKMEKNSFAKGKDLKNDFMIIAESLIEGKFWLDPEAKALIEKYGGKEIAKEVNSEMPNIEPELLGAVLEEFILRKSGTIIDWLKTEDKVIA